MKLYPLLAITMVASGAILPYRICAATATDDELKQGASSAEKLFGVSGQIGAEAGEPIDVHVAGIVPVTYGGNVAAGDLLTTDATGRAVVATDGARVIGLAAENGDADTLGSMLIAPSKLTPSA